MAYFSALETLYRAQRILVTHPGKIKDRLFEAFIELVPLSGQDFPEELREDFTWIRQTLTKNPAKIVNGKSTGRMGATIPFMRINKAVEVAERIQYIIARLEDICNDES